MNSIEKGETFVDNILANPYVLQPRMNILNSATKYLKLPTSQKVIYHYTSPAGALGILDCTKNKNKKPSLWFTRYDSLNDVNERKNIYKYAKDYCEKKVKEGAISKKIGEMIVSAEGRDGVIVVSGEDNFEWSGQQYPLATIKYLDCHVYLCCFSMDADLLPMWNYYSKSKHYEGYSIGFYHGSLENDVFNETGYITRVGKVIYSDEDKETIFDSILLPLAYEYEKGKITEKIVKNSIKELIEVFQFFFKDKAFEHEKEVRCVLYVPKDKNIREIPRISDVQYRESNGYIVPYVVYDCDKFGVKKIVTAPLLEKDLAVKNMKEYLSSQGYSDGIDVVASEVPIRF